MEYHGRLSSLFISRRQLSLIGTPVAPELIKDKNNIKKSSQLELSHD